MPRTYTSDTLSVQKSIISKCSTNLGRTMQLNVLQPPSELNTQANRI